MMKFYRRGYFIFFICLLLASFSQAGVLVDAGCRSYQLDEGGIAELDNFGRGVLWKVAQEGVPSSYIFGTIHVSDKDILQLPGDVERALRQSDIFVMEALPEPEEAITFAGMMFFTDGTRLDSLISPVIFQRTVDILSSYHIPAEAVSIMKPWAAFLTMNYPANAGTVLDLQLLQLAKENGSRIHGLESLQEQGEIFSGLSVNDQLTLLRDTVCHYDLVLEDFDKMKTLYLTRDLQGLFRYGQRYKFTDNSVYDELLRRVLTNRNHIMTQRMQSLLEKGSAFVAIGVLHLPGKDGILSLLEKEGYKITVVY